MSTERVKVRNVSKRFKIGFQRSLGALARFLYLFSGRESKKFITALKNVSLSVSSGDILGIIGENGSGKSTLLRIIAGIYSQSLGEIQVNGKIVSLINLNVGLKERLSMRDNIYLSCSLFGLSNKEIKERFQKIVEFSELGEFVNTKLYQFSDGMKQRLAFSIGINCNPEILLLDEVFAVGDEEFRIKSARKIQELVKSGASVILVTHELWMIEKYCDSAVWLDGGEIIKKGDAKKVITAYLKHKHN